MEILNLSHPNANVVWVLDLISLLMNQKEEWRPKESNKFISDLMSLDPKRVKAVN